MKASAFGWTVPDGLEQAAALLADEDSRAMSGGQSLGPMLNLRVVRPAMVVPLAGLAGLRGAEETADAVTLGAAVTHAAIADGRTPDLAGGVLARVAAGSRIGRCATAGRSAAVSAMRTRRQTG